MQRYYPQSALQVLKISLIWFDELTNELLNVKDVIMDNSQIENKRQKIKSVFEK